MQTTKTRDVRLTPAHGTVSIGHSHSSLSIGYSHSSLSIGHSHSSLSIGHSHSSLSDEVIVTGQVGGWMKNKPVSFSFVSKAQGDLVYGEGGVEVVVSWVGEGGISYR